MSLKLWAGVDQLIWRASAPGWLNIQNEDVWNGVQSSHVQAEMHLLFFLHFLTNDASVYRVETSWDDAHPHWCLDL